MMESIDTVLPGQGGFVGSTSIFTCEPHWYAAHTRANHEKSVAAQLARRSIEHYLPLYESMRVWKDRRKRLHLPLFPGYVFVHFELRNRLQVLQIPGLVRLVGFGGIPKSLDEDEIQNLRSAIAKGARAEPFPYVRKGRRVRIIRGPFAGFDGIALRQRKNLRVVLKMDFIQRAILVDVDASCLEIPPE